MISDRLEELIEDFESYREDWEYQRSRNSDKQECEGLRADVFWLGKSLRRLREAEACLKHVRG